MGRGIRLFLVPALIHFVLSIPYLLSFPLWRAPDEGAHLGYVVHLIRSGSFPVFQGMSGPVTYEAHQPPLFYVSGIPFLWFLTEREEDRTTGLLLLRFVSTFWSLLTVLSTISLAVVLTQDPNKKRITGLLAGLFASVHPVHLLISGSVTNDSAAGATASATIAWLCYLLTRKQVSHQQGTLLGALTGLFAGLALLAKQSNIFLLPLAFLPALPMVPRLAGLKKKKQESVNISPAIAFCVGVVVTFGLSAGWWLVRNQHLYGDPLAIGAFLQGFEKSPGPQYFLDRGFSWSQYWLLVAQVSWFTWLGIFGEPNAAMRGLARLSQGQEPTLPFVLIVCLLGLSLLLPIVLGAVQSVRDSIAQLKNRQWSAAIALLLPLITVGIVLAQFVAFNVRFFQGQARYWYPAHSAMAYLFAAGLLRVVPTNRPVIPIAAAALPLLLISLIVLLVWVPRVG
ncbi:MAG: phospholipid carrier-dependent glycosyltransferase [Armatimonadetes bacterium]|nr:phospholipid carrier-dependent glycosyltransferase [Armatimonadota bacterium]MDW8121103.1 phospholipid carrier-dependent glycosyltransferase [Armatimonadota bacterium]